LGLTAGSVRHVKSVLDLLYPYDEISGYTMARIESKILPYAKGKWTLKEKIKSNKPQGITDKHIDLWYEMFQKKL